MKNTTNIASMHFLNGKFVSEERLLISPRDLGYSRGYGVFDFLVTYKQRPYMLDKHVDRLFKSAEIIALDIPWSKKEVSEWVLKTLQANESIPGEKVIRIIISGGSSFSLTLPRTPTIVIMVDPNISCPAEDYKNGVEILLVEFERYRAEAKTNNYIEAVCTFNKIPSTVDEIVYHSNDMVREGSRSNIFAIINNRLLTPKTKILEGVTRNVLLSILKLHIPVVVEDFTVADLHRASEVFITATGKEVMPVTKLDGIIVGDGKVGPITKEVMEQHKSFIQSALW